MGLPPRVYYTLGEAAARWGCSIGDVAAYAAAGQIHIATGIPPVRCGERIIAGLVHVPAADMLAMFRRCGSGPDRIAVHRIKPLDSEDWIHVDGDECLSVAMPDLVIMADDARRFEAEHQIFGAVHNIGRPRNYPWEDMLISMMIRVHEQGVPETQAEWVRELVEWFERRNPDGQDIPDESSIRKKIAPIWKLLRGA